MDINEKKRKLEAIRAAREAKQRIVEQYAAKADASSSPSQMLSRTQSLMSGTMGVVNLATVDSPTRPLSPTPVCPPAARVLSVSTAAAAAASPLPQQQQPQRLWLPQTPQTAPPTQLGAEQPPRLQQEKPVAAVPRVMHSGLEATQHWALKEPPESATGLAAICALNPLVCLVNEGRAATDIAVTSVSVKNEGALQEAPTVVGSVACVAVAYTTAATSEVQHGTDDATATFDSRLGLETDVGYPWGTPAGKSLPPATAMPLEVVSSQCRRAPGLVLTWTLLQRCTEATAESMRLVEDPHLAIVTPLLCDEEICSLTAHPFRAGVILGGTRGGRIVMWHVASEWSAVERKQLHAMAMGSTGSSGTLVWRPQRPVSSSFPSPQSHGGPVLRLAVHGDSNCHHLYSISQEGRVCTWATTKLLQPLTVRNAYRGKHTVGHVGTVAAMVSQKGSDAVTKVYMGTTSGEVLEGLNGGTRAVEMKYVAPAGVKQSSRITAIAVQSRGADGFREADCVVSASLDGSCIAFIGDASAPIRGLSSVVTALQWSPTHPTIMAAGSARGVVTLWDINRSLTTPVASLHVHNFIQLQPAGTTASAAVLALAKSENASLAAAGNMTLASPLEDVSAAITSVAFSDNGEWLLAGTASGTVLVLKLSAPLCRTGKGLPTR